MTLIEIITIVGSVSFVSAVLGNYIYKKIKGIPTGDCGYCHKGTAKLLKEYHKLYK